MAHRMRRHAFCQADLLARLGGDLLNRTGIHWVTGSAGEEPRPRLEGLPVVPESFKQCGRERNVAVLFPFASTDMNYHSFAIDVSDLQFDDFGDAEAASIDLGNY